MVSNLIKEAKSVGIETHAFSLEWAEEKVSELITTSTLYPVKIIVREVFQNKANLLEVLAEQIVKGFRNNLDNPAVFSST
jgi:hypothetical protein